MCPKKCDDFFRELICGTDVSLKTIIQEAKESKSLGALSKKLLHYHEIIDKNYCSYRYVILNSIIREKHPNLYEDLMQIFEMEPDNIKFYQCRLNKKSRLIFTILESDNESTFIPLLFDLNHTIYISDKKQYDDNKEFNNCRWDFREDQEKIKKFLLS